jgi:hypothetical protein
MRKVLIGIIFGLGLAVCSAAAQEDYCFQNDSLRPGYMVSFTVTNNKIEGFFNRGDTSGKTSGTNFDFTGTKKGDLLTIVFKSGKAPYERPPRTRRIVWTIRSPRRMTIPMYRKNHKSGKLSTYTAIFGPCRDI